MATDPRADDVVPGTGDVSRLRELVENAPDIISRFDRALRHTYVNRAVERATGLPAAAFFGKTHTELGMPPEMTELWSERIRRVFDGGIEDAFDFEFPAPDGPRHYRAHIVPEFAPGDSSGAPGSVDSVLAIVRDATDRVRLDAQLRQAETMDAVGRLAGGIAHDFNNLLTVITTYSQFLLDGMPDDDRRRDDVAEIRNAADRAATLTQRLLTLSRRQLLQPRVVDVSAVVAGVEPLVRRLVGEHVELVTRFAPDLPPVLADPGQLEQVVMSLALNARDAMPAGGVLTITTAAGPDRTVRLAVRDTGTGMDAATRAHAVEPFFTTKPRGAGMGLGLSTVHGIVEQSGGRLTLDSVPGQGTEVTVSLPPAPESAGQSPGRAGGAHETRGGTETVFVVDDEDAVRASVRRVLEARGYRVLEAQDGTEAIAASRRHTGVIHLLLTDLVMPAMGGAEVAERLTRERPGLRVMYMSGYSDDAAGHGGSLGAGAVLLHKPFTLAGLAQAVRLVLDEA